MIWGSYNNLGRAKFFPNGEIPVYPSGETSEDGVLRFPNRVRILDSAKTNPAPTR